MRRARIGICPTRTSTTSSGSIRRTWSSDMSGASSVRSLIVRDRNGLIPRGRDFEMTRRVVLPRDALSSPTVRASEGVK